MSAKEVTKTSTRCAWRIETHLRNEYRWAASARQAAALVWREYRCVGCSPRLRNGWKVFPVAHGACAGK